MLIVSIVCCKLVRHFWSRDNWTNGQLEYFDESHVSVNESIFFLDTSLKTRRSWPGRLGCSLESVVKQNPGRKVFVIVDIHSGIKAVPNYFSALSEVYFVVADFKALSRGTPGFAIWENGELEAAKIRVVCTSELMRLVLLYKFGGVFADMDYIFKAPLPWSASNFFASQYNGNVNGALMRFGKGHPYLKLALENYVSIFFSLM